MKLYRTIFLLLLVNLICINGFSQNDRGILIINESISFEGEIELPRSWPNEVRFKRFGNQNFETFNASEVTSLVFNNSEHYMTMPVETESGDSVIIFVRVLSTGKLNVYKYPFGKHRYMIYDGEFSPLTLNNYRQIINELADPCKEFRCRHKRTMFNTYSLAFFFNRYNEEKLNTRFPMMNAGFSLQFNANKWTLPGFYQIGTYFDNFTSKSKYISPAIFIHMPFYKYNGLGFDFKISRHTQVILHDESKMVNNFWERTGYIADLMLDWSFIQTDLGMRYSWAWYRFEPYFSGGISHMHIIQNTSQIYHYGIHIYNYGTANKIYTLTIQDGIYEKPGTMLGFYINPGVQFYIFPRTFIAAEGGYSKHTAFRNPEYQSRNLFVNLKVNFWPW
ncbi:MAG: hypothetical protein EA361_02860 [Bacteroidetes bacterium]|nr:MAG: hypothetical protein EA361_02860 [Bacteroidota bacterium]